MKLLSYQYKEFTPFRDPKEAVDALVTLYEGATKFLSENLLKYANGHLSDHRVRACYPEIRITVESHVRLDSRLSFGHVSFPGEYTTTITHPTLFRHYLEEQIRLLIESHQIDVYIGISDTPIAVHFALPEGADDLSLLDEEKMRHLRDFFDVPDLEITHDKIVNGDEWVYSDGAKPLSNFTAPRTDYSLARLAHYTATSPHHFQNYVLFTNYQFYVDEFQKFALSEIENENSRYESFVAAGDIEFKNGKWEGTAAARMPQMPAYHLKAKNGNGITLVNIGVGPSNARTITDHIAVLRPHCWLMVGHCAGLRNSQHLGDYVLAHAYMREDKVLDKDLPPWVPIPALSEIQKALEVAMADITKLNGYALKQIMRTGTVASVDNRNWELDETNGHILRLSQARAVALDMESATIAANGFRFRVPYGTLLTVSDKPLHGELKLPGMASAFYSRQISQHLRIGIRALEILQGMPVAELHSRKLRSFNETAFL